MRMPKLSDEQIQDGLSSLSGWIYAQGTLRKTYTFKDFTASLQFVNAVGARAEAADHHPDIDIRYNKVTLVLVTHDSGGVTQNDLDLAKEAETVASA